MGGFLASRIMSDVFQGVDNGIVYSLVALSLVIIWQSTNVLNFAQGAMAMFATYVGMTQVDRGLNFWLCLFISLAVGILIGGITERVLVRPLYGKPPINPIVVMVGFLSLLEFAAAAIWTSNTKNLPSPFSQIDYSYHGRTILLSPFIFFQIITALAIMAIVAIVFRYTKLGLQLRAAALAPETARLLGVRVNRMLTAGWMIATGVGTIAGVIVATSGGGSLNPTVMDTYFISGFIAAAIGGLSSPAGAVVGGLLLGLIEQFAQDYGNINIAPIAGLMVLVVVLMIRPQGLFTRTTSRRV